MRVDELHLKAFGPFANRRLDLSAGSRGLHVIFGPNEAGKSSALRALKALLYGIDERTTDTFLHGNEQLRVGGRLRLADGRDLAFVRRKGRKNTLLEPVEERPIEDGRLTPFLGGVDKDVFSTLFGIDHRALVDGGEQILEQKGDVGRTLFAAALGSRPLEKILAELEAEAAELYRQHGSKPSINKALADWKAARRETKDATLAVKDWGAHQKALDDANRRLAVLRSELDVRLKEQNAIERLRRILPKVARRREVLMAIEAMGAVVELPSDFGEQRRSLEEKLAGATEALALDRPTLERAQEEMAKLAPPERILREAGTIEALYQELGSYRKSLHDRPIQEGKRQQARTNAREILKRLRPDLSLEDAAALRPAIAAAKRPIQDLATRHQTLEAAARKTSKALADKDHEIATLQEELEAFPEDQDAGPLARAASEARRAGELDRLLRQALLAEKNAETQCRDSQASIGLWQGPLNEACALPVPTAATVDRYDEAFQGASDRLRSLAKDRRKTEEEQAEVERSLQEMRLAGQVPTELDLIRARTRREQGWALVKREWRDGTDVTAEARAFDGDHDLPEAYEATVVQADEVADRLRREAGRVATHAQSLARLEQLAKILADMVQQASAETTAMQVLHGEWAAVWSPCGITPLPPREMRAWLTRLESLQGRVAALAEARTRVEELRQAIGEHQASLTARLQELGVQPVEPGPKLGPLLEQADAVVQAVEAIAAKKKDLRRLAAEREKLVGELERAASDLEAWKSEWRAALAALEQPPETLPAMVQSQLEGYAELFVKIDDADALGRRIEFGIDKDLRTYEARARAFVQEVAPDLEDSDIARSVERLNEALKRARVDETTRGALRQRVRDLGLQIEATEEKVRKTEEALLAIRDAAGCASLDEVDAAVQRSDACRKLREQVSELEQAIVEAGEGAALETLVQQAEPTRPDDLPPRLEHLRQEIREREEERERQRETKGAEESELRRMTGASRAADAAGGAQEILASLRRHVERYLRVRTASLVLRREIERYREANQDPLVVRGGELFAALTQGSFQALRSEIAEDDEPRLVGVRPDGRLVRVEGMSSGTRDQLYLALRLATLERFLSTSEAMPFVVDDILVNFDDDRARTTLGVLADFSGRTQVLLFTHHERIREMARGLSSPHGVFVQQLP